MPKFWLMSLLIGILKQDKDAADPSSYRLIALECCMLKMLTLIIGRRIREDATDIGAIPTTQNGFQDGLRTNDNVFVLLCLIDMDSEGTVLLEIVPAITPDGNFHDGDFIEGGSVNSPFDSGCVQGLSLFAAGFISLGPCQKAKLMTTQFSFRPPSTKVISMVC